MATIIIVLFVWLFVSVLVGLVLGRILAQGSDHYPIAAQPEERTRPAQPMPRPDVARAVRHRGTSGG